MLRIMPNRHNQRGAAVLIFSILLLALLGLVSLVVNFSYSRAVTEKLQVAADAVAHSAAVSLCSSQKCWNEALNVAKSTFHEQLLHGSLATGGKADLSVSFPEQVEGDQNTWKSGNYKVTIMRGRWWPSNPPQNADTLATEPKFEPFDSAASDWQLSHTGIPHFLAANGVYVKIEQEVVPFFLRIFTAGFYDRDAQAVATGNRISSVKIAPFAIHACSLLKKGSGQLKGEFDPQLMCGIDRVFTRTSRFCSPADQNCDALPGFYYYPANDEMMQSDECNSTNADNIERQKRCLSINDDQSDAFNPTLEQCRYEPGGGMRTYSFSAGSELLTSDFFGIVGLPGDEKKKITEDEIRKIFTQMNTDSEEGLPAAYIGATFNVLSEGLKEKATEDAIWQFMRNDKPRPENNAWKDTPLQSLLVNGISAGGSCDDYRDLYDDGVAPIPSLGVCNSKRIEFNDSEYCTIIAGEVIKVSDKFKCADDNDSNTADPVTGPIFPCPVITDQGPQRNLPVWQTAIAVIASLGEDQTCAGLTGGSHDPIIDPNKHYEIIGFVKASIFDLDIGNPPPTVPTNLASCSKLQSITPWGFQAPDGGGCNLIRARLSCEEELIASDVTVTPRKPYLVK